MRKQAAFMIGLTTWCFLLTFLQGSAQQSSNNTTFGPNFLFNMYTTERANMVTQPTYFSISDTAVDDIFERLKYNEQYMAIWPASPVMLGVKLNSRLTNFHSAVVPSVSQNYYSFLINDSSDAILIAMGINEDNYQDFRYHVVENDSIELVPWSPVTDLRTEYGAHQPFGFIGKFNYPGKWIVVEVCNSKNYAVREGVVFDWRIHRTPALQQIIVGVPNNYFNLASPAVNRGYATKFNQLTNIPEDLQFPADSIRYLTFQFKKEESRVYSVHLIRQVKQHRDTLSLGVIDPHGYFSANPVNFRQPGLYEIVFQRQSRYPEWNEAQLLRIPFEVTAVISDNWPTKNTLLLLVIISVILLLTLWIYKQRMKKMMQRLAVQQETAQLKLKIIRSQLNPHFIFNALSSIQNLMNKQATQEANRYLSLFAKLTRSTLESSEQQYISLQEEWEIARNYLQMEQLRFGFTYLLKMDSTLPSDNIEIPPMLLQPLIENAVKHGVSGKPDGTIQVTAARLQDSLLLTVEDNGRGFVPGSISKGLGLRLSSERLELLNNMYPEKPFSLHVQSSDSGTIITITLKKWLL